MKYSLSLVLYFLKLFFLSLSAGFVLYLLLISPPFKDILLRSLVLSLIAAYFTDPERFVPPIRPSSEEIPASYLINQKLDEILTSIKRIESKLDKSLS